MAYFTKKRLMSKIAKEIPATMAKSLDLAKGEGYMYFVYDDGQMFTTKSIMVAHMNTLPIESWVEEAKTFIKEVQEEISQRLM